MDQALMDQSLRRCDELALRMRLEFTVIERLARLGFRVEFDQPVADAAWVAWRCGREAPMMPLEPIA